MNLTKLEDIFIAKNLDVIISTSYQTRLWYSKINTTAGFLFIQKNKADLFVDGRYIEMANANAKNVSVNFLSKKELETFCSSNKDFKNIGLEKDYLTLEEKEKIKNLFPNSNFILISAQELRILKSEDEIINIKKSAQIALKAFNKVKFEIKPGISENQIKAKLEYYFQELGAEKPSFDTIVVSGVRTSLPHGRPTNKVIENGDLVTIDFGTFFNGYACDITRTFEVGKVNNLELLKIKKIVYDAQQKGIKAIKPGLTTSYIDNICRDYIKEQGYGQYFVHGTGHGVGIDIHELPYVSPFYSETILEPGMVITIEPGIYIPGLGGVRFEDDILITKTGYEVLTSN